jgi:translocation and assembly module TamB
MTLVSRIHSFFSALRVRRLLLYGSLSLLVTLLLLAAIVAALPSMLSSRSGQDLLRQSLTKSLKRPVTWGNLAISWSDGLEVQGLSLGTGPAPLLKAVVGDLLLVPKVGYRNGRVQIDLLMRVRSLAAQLAPGPPAPPKPYQEPLSALAKSLQQFEALDWPLPIDLSLQLAVDPVNLSYRDPKTGQRLTLGNGSLHLEAPSLADRPIALEMGGDLDLAGHRIEALSLKADLKQLVSSSRRLRPSAAVLALSATLPGTSLTVQGGLREPGGVKARARLDLPRLMALAGPLLPSTLLALRGELTFDLQAKADAVHNLQADLALNGSRIELSGGQLKKGRVGPLDLQLRQKILSDHQRQQVRFADGSASVGSWLSAAWEASVERPADRDRDLSARLGPVRVDLRQALAAAAPFLPPKSPVQELTGELNLRQVLVQLHGRQNRGEVALSGLGVRLPRLRLALGTDRLTADGIELALEKATLPLADLQPTRADAALTWGVQRAALTGARPLVADELRGGLRLSLTDLKVPGAPSGRNAGSARAKSTPDTSLAGDRKATTPLPTRVEADLSYTLRRLALAGAQPLTVDGVRGDLQLSLKDLNLKSSSPRKVAANGELKESLELVRVKLERQLSVDNFRQQLQAGFKAKENGEIELALPLFKLGAAALQAKASGKDLKPVALAADLSAAGIRLPADRTLPSVDSFTCAATCGDFLKLAATGGVSAASPPVARTDGNLRLDLGRLLPVAAPLLPKGVAATGTGTVTWKITAPTGQKPAPAGKDRLSQARAALALVERGELSLALDSQGIAYPLSSGKIQLARLRTAQPFQLLLPGRGGNLQLQGGFEFAGLQGLPGAAASLPAQNGSLSLKGELAELQSLRLHEELKVQQFALVQQADANIGRIDALLQQKEPFAPATMLQRLDADLNAQVAARFPATPTPVPGGAKLSGDLSAALRVNLAAGRTLRLRASALTREFGAWLADGTLAEGVNADLLVDRSYALAKGEPVGWTPLSSSLVHPVAEQFGGQGAAELVNRVREDLRGEVRGSRRFTVRRVVTGAGKAGGTPIELSSLEGDLLLTPEQVGLSFLQAELLGGTVRLRGLVDLRPEVPAVSAACSFSNLETYLLLPPEGRGQAKKARQDTAVTGELSLDAPLVTGQRALVEGVRMQLNLRKIGADTLERALFGLDPYERNEQIVAQRKLLRQGTLKRLHAGTLDGSFSFDGDVVVRGVNVALPRVERIRLAELPIQKELAKTVAGVASARKLLDLLRADTLSIGPKGEISLGRRGHE